MDALRSRLLPLAAALAAAFLFFLPFVTSGGDLLSGDLGDNRLHLVILEHWRAIAAGQAAPLSPNFFAPIQGVLAYSDALILYVPPYLLFRALTGDPPLAYQFTLIVVKILGFLALYALLRRAAGFAPALAAWAAGLFALSNMYAASLGHGQLLSVAFLPLILWLLVLAWELRPLPAHACAAAAALLLALLFLTAYYVAFFFGLSLGLCTILFLILELRARTNRFPFRRALPLAASAAVAFSAGIIPFLLTYLPAYRAAGPRPYEVVQDQILSVSQIVSPGPANFAWGGMVQDFGSIFQVHVLREIGRGWAPITFLCFLAAAFALWRGPKTTPAQRFGAAACVTVLLLALAATSLGGLQPWRLIHHYVPGAGGIRVPHRLNLVLNLAVVLVLANWFRNLLRNKDRRLALTALGFLLIVEQLNWNAFPSYSRQAERAFLGRVPPPPPSCRSFYISHSPRPDNTQVDAMLLARRFNLPTLNGYSGLNPPGWTCGSVESVCALTLQAWAQQHNIAAGLCALNTATATATWSPAPAAKY